MAEKPANILWLSLGLALVGGYADAASFLLAQTFTGHITGNFVLMAISLASQEWPTFFRRGLAIAFFLMGIILSVALEQWLEKKPFRTILSAVPLVEIALILAAYGALTAPLAAHLELFTVCMALPWACKTARGGKRAASPSTRPILPAWSPAS